jgi:hypothetical protein
VLFTLNGTAVGGAVTDGNGVATLPGRQPDRHRRGRT